MSEIKPGGPGPEEQKPESELPPDLEAEKIDNLIEAQLGKTVDLNIGDSWLPETRKVFTEIQEAMGIKGRMDGMQQAVSFVNDNLERVTHELSGIMEEFYNPIRENADRGDPALWLVELPLKLIHRTEKRGIILLSKIEGMNGISFDISVNEGDWEQSLSLVRMFPGKLNRRVEEIAAIMEKQIDEISKLVSDYQSGKKPNPQDCLNGRSITEPVLQFLRGGTSHEGLSGVITGLGKPIAMGIGVHLVGTSEKRIPVELKVIFGNFGIMREGAKVSMDYLKFISTIFEENPDTRTGARATDLEATVQRYLDKEWQHKDEAIALAERTRDVIKKELEFFESLRS